MSNFKLYMDTMFNFEEFICLGRTVYDIKTYTYNERLKEPLNWQFVAINSFKPLLLRADANVSTYRNILLEFDKGTIDEQLAYITDLGIPYSNIVYSGGKSLHVTICLMTDLGSKDAYDALVRRIYAKVPKADQSTKNCSRFTRLAEATRDNGKHQTLRRCLGRVSLAKLDEWLGPPPLELKPPYKPTPNNYRLLKGTTLFFLAHGAEEGSWNQQLFLAALDMFRSGYSKSEVFDRLEHVTGHLDSKDQSTIRSALKVAI
jgi:hypothetical protein